MTLGDVAAVETIVARPIVACVAAKRAINRWATAKYLRIQCEIDWNDLLTPEQARHLAWRTRLRRWRRTCIFRLVQRLMTRAHRIARYDLFNQLMAELDRSEHLPVPPGRDPLVVKAAAIAKHERDRRQVRQRARIHRKVMCASGCGTRYGKRRHDHNFFGGSGIEGGWLCPTNLSCIREPAGEHYCGMCDLEAGLSTLGQCTEQLRDLTASSEDVKTAIANDRGTREAAARRASERDGHEFAPTPEEQGVARPPTEGRDETPAQTPGGDTPEPSTVR